MVCGVFVRLQHATDVMLQSFMCDSIRATRAIWLVCYYINAQRNKLLCTKSFLWEKLYKNHSLSCYEQVSNSLQSTKGESFRYEILYRTFHIRTLYDSTTQHACQTTGCFILPWSEMGPSRIFLQDRTFPLLPLLLSLLLPIFNCVPGPVCEREMEKYAQQILHTKLLIFYFII